MTMRLNPAIRQPLAFVLLVTTTCFGSSAHAQETSSSIDSAAAGDKQVALSASRKTNAGFEVVPTKPETKGPLSAPPGAWCGSGPGFVSLYARFERVVIG